MAAPEVLVASITRSICADGTVVVTVEAETPGECVGMLHALDNMQARHGLEGLMRRVVESKDDGADSG